MSLYFSYICWNIHESTKGVFDFDDRKDFVRFIELAQAHDLLVILRPTPYCDAEIDAGGIPVWILKEQLPPRTNNTNFMNYVDKWFSMILPKVIPLLYSNDGPVISLQIENEYGLFDSNKNYLDKLKSIMEKHLNYSDVIYFTTDSCRDSFLANGFIEGALSTIDFPPNSKYFCENCMKLLNNYQENGPFMNSELYTGWFTSWNSQRVTTDPYELAEIVNFLLEMGYSLNLYMFYGGTNWDFIGGSVYDSGRTNPVITSYDYDGPITESGDITLKYLLLRKAIEEYLRKPLPNIPLPTPKLLMENIAVTQVFAFFQNYKEFILSSIQTKNYCLSFEQMDSLHGYMLYSITLPTSRHKVSVFLKKVGDYVVVYDQTHHKTVTSFYRSSSQPLIFNKRHYNIKLLILVENLGRIANGIFSDPKGINEIVFEPLFPITWRNMPVNLANFFNTSLRPSKTTVDAAFYTSSFQLQPSQILNTYMKLNSCFQRGRVYVNEHNIGRFNFVEGPQLGLFIPDSYLKIGENSVVIFSNVGLNCSTLHFDLIDKQSYK